MDAYYTQPDRWLRRRTLLAGIGGSLLLPGIAAAAAGPDIGLLEDAAIWGVPLVRTGRYHALAQAKGLSDNRFYLNQTLATPSLRLAAPNVDTIYGFAWIDVSNGPVAVQVPDARDRYYSIQFIDAYETILGYAGSGATSRGTGLFVVTGPGWTGTLPAGAKRIDAPTSLVLALTRTLVKGAADLPAAQALQASYALSPLSASGGVRRGAVLQDALSVFPRLDLTQDAPAFFAQLDALVRRFPPRGQEAIAAGRLAPLHLGAGPITSRFTAAQQQAALDAALTKVRAQGRRISDTDDGWSVNYHIRPFNADPATRAALNSVGPGAHIAEEALYFTAATDSTGAPLVGTRRYEISFPKGGLPPAKEFWSLILYDAKSLFLVPNRLNRYTINDRTPDLAYDPDGSLRIVLSHDAPAGGGGNWLPAPETAFSLVLRTYQPDATLLSGRYRVPPVVRQG